MPFDILNYQIINADLMLNAHDLFGHIPVGTENIHSVKTELLITLCSKMTFSSGTFQNKISH